MFHPDGPSFFELAEQALSSTTRGYDLLAPKFEHTPFRTPDELVEPLARAAARGRLDRALDCCCGNGAVARSLRKHTTEQVIGIDLSAGMLATARELVDETPGDADVDFVQMDAFDMEFDEPFDVVATAGAFGHILEHQQDRFLEEVWRVLRPGGRFLFVTASMPSVTDRRWWMARGFNAAMHVRNALIKPPFVMFYLTFTLDRALDMLLKHGFEVRVEAPYQDTPFPQMRLVIATRPQDAS